MKITTHFLGPISVGTKNNSALETEVNRAIEGKVNELRYTNSGKFIDSQVRFTNDGIRVVLVYQRGN